MPYQISVIISLVQDARTMESQLTDLIAILNEMSLTHQIILVCKDSDEEIWNQVVDIPKKMRAVSAYKARITNGLNGMALCGVMQAKGELICTLTNEFKHPHSALRSMHAALIKSNCDLIYARNKKRSNWIRRALVKSSRVFFALTSNLGAELSHYRLMKSHTCKTLKAKTPYLFLFDQLIRPEIQAYNYLHFESEQSPASLTSLLLKAFKWSPNLLAWTYIGEGLILILLVLNIGVLLKGRLFLSLILGASALLIIWLTYLSKWRRRIAFRITDRSK